MQLLDSSTILDKTESVCPVCLQVISAEVVVVEGAVYQQKTCPAHGPFTIYLWPDVTHYRWMKDFKFPCKQPQLPVAALQGCPDDCGLCANHLRKPTLVEIELTQRCNLRCPVCFMAADEVYTVPPDPDLTTIEGMYKAILAKTGPQTSIQLTGGEPTIIRKLPEIVCMGRSIGFNAIEVNTNGVVIAQQPSFIEQLAEAGISGIYLQFDGVTREVYEKIRGKDLLAMKLQAIENCRAAGVQVVLAMTLIRGINHEQVGAVLDFAMQHRDVIAGIAYQPAFGSGRFEVSNERRLTMGDVTLLLEEQSKGLIEAYDFWPLGCSHSLCDAATYLVEHQGRQIPLTRLITAAECAENFDPDSPQGSVFGDIAAKMFPQLEPGLSIVIMDFMDAFNLDLKRLRECSMTVAGPDGRIIPFCRYQLTNMNGEKMEIKRT